MHYKLFFCKHEYPLLTPKQIQNSVRMCTLPLLACEPYQSGA